MLILGMIILLWAQVSEAKRLSASFVFRYCAFIWDLADDDSDNGRLAHVDRRPEPA